MFDYRKPTIQLLGRWQPWHEGHKHYLNVLLKKQDKSVSW